MVEASAKETNVTQSFQVPEFKPGDRVRYTTKWLDSVGAGPTDDLRHRLGTVVEDESKTFTRVEWDDGELIHVHPANLAGEHEVSARALDHAKGFNGFDIDGRKQSPWAAPMTKGK